MKPPLSLIPALLLGCATCLPGQAVLSSTFGPGKAGLAAAGAGQARLFSPQARVSVRFTAAHTGALTEFGFGVIPGSGFSSGQANAFTVVLHADRNGAPGAEIARATKTLFNDAGARARSALFQPGVPVRAGTVYHLVIASPWADGGDRVFGVTHTRLARGIVPVDSFEMAQADVAAAVLTATDGGAVWTPVEQSIATHEIVINGQPQGWGYTGTLELPLKRGPAGTQYVMQTFAFRTGGARGRKVVPASLHVSVRPQGALAGRPVKLFAHIVTPSSFHTMAEAYATVTLADTSRFEPVALAFSEGTLVEGANYVLILGLAEEVTAGPDDFVFLRGYNWGIGFPNLSELSWQGTEGCAYFSPTATTLGEPRPGGDVPFLIDYQPAP